MVITDNNWAGPRKFKVAYVKALSIEQKMASGLNTMLEKLSFCVVTDCHGLPDEALPDVITLEQLGELWEKAGDSVHAALAIMKNEQAPQLFSRYASPGSTRPLYVMRRWLMDLVYLL